MSSAVASSSPSPTPSRGACRPTDVPPVEAPDPERTLGNAELALRLKSPDDVLAAVQAEQPAIQDFRPLAASLDWELGQLYWDEQGTTAFLGGDVPYVINNDGNLSWNAAQVFFVSLAIAEQQGTLEPHICALELGIGLGLFARFFLDVFRYLCLHHQKDYYDRLCYLAVDRSERMLADVRRHEILSGHEGHYRLLRGNAYPFELPRPPNSPRAIFLNYALDPLPAAVLKIDEQPIRQLCVRTCLARGVDIRHHTDLTTEDIVRLAASPDPADRRLLLDLYKLFALDLDYRPVTDLASVPYADVAVRLAPGDEPFVLLNYGAIHCLESCLKILHPAGFVLMNDYGCAPAPEPAEAYRHQRFGGSTAISVNFPLLKKYFQQTPDCIWAEPVEDNEHIRGRFLGRRPTPETVACFEQVFSKAAADWKQQPVEQARLRLKEGRYEATLQAYREAVQRQPNNWALMAEIAEMLTFSIRDYQAGVDMAKAGLALNPINPQLLNALGDGLFCLDRFDEAHDIFFQAIALDPANVRARYNLIYTFAQRHDYAGALEMIAEGLALDKSGEYRERLLEKQKDILGRLDDFQRKQGRLLADRFTWRRPGTQSSAKNSAVPGIPGVTEVS